MNRRARTPEQKSKNLDLEVQDKFINASCLSEEDICLDQYDEVEGTMEGLVDAEMFNCFQAQPKEIANPKEESKYDLDQERE